MWISNGMSLIEFRTSRGKKEESGFEIENPINIINCLFSKTETNNLRITLRRTIVTESFTLASISCFRLTIRLTHSSAVALISLLTASARARSLAAMALTSCTASWTGGIFLSMQKFRRSSMSTFRSSRASFRPKKDFQDE